MPGPIVGERGAVDFPSFILVVAVACIITSGCIGPLLSPADQEPAGTQVTVGRIPLPEPQTSGTISVEEAIHNRRSVREFDTASLDLTDLSQLLWAAQGMSGPSGLRTAPSAGALYPLEIYVASGNVTGLPSGVYHYLPDSHTLERIWDHDIRKALFRSSLSQTPVRDAPAVIIIAADYRRTTGTYGERGIRYVQMEAGHVSENIYLQAYPLGIGTVAIGAFDDNTVKSVLGLPAYHEPLYLMPVGTIHRRTS